MQGAYTQPAESITKKKRSPLRGLTLLFYFSPAGGGGYWRGLVSKGAALLHQRVYYDRDAPCETEVLLPSAISGCNV
jgi:hypothetical protein